jgi:hypothetical protein
MSNILSIGCVLGGLYLLTFGPIASDIFLLNQGLGLALLIGGPIILKKM